MHVHPDKATSTCSQHFAELDPHCPSMFAGACESFKDDADACRLSLTCLRRLSACVTDVVHTEPAGHLHAWPDGQEGAVMTRGQSPAVTVAYSTRQTRLQLVSTPNCGNYCQLPSSSHVAGALK